MRIRPFPDDDLIDKVRCVIENRVEDIDSEELDATLDRMEYILQCWEDWNPRKWEPARTLTSLTLTLFP